MELFDKRSRRRAKQAFMCLPFNCFFYQKVRNKGLSAKIVLNNFHKYSDNATSQSNLQKIESHFSWMIKVGILRREVDGQGLTASVRLTPSGRRMIEEDNTLLDLKPTFVEYSSYLIYRYLIRR